MSKQEGEPHFVPLAIPAVAGRSIMVFRGTQPNGHRALNGHATACNGCKNDAHCFPIPELTRTAEMLALTSRLAHHVTFFEE